MLSTQTNFNFACVVVVRQKHKLKSIQLVVSPHSTVSHSL